MAKSRKEQGLAKVRKENHRKRIQKAQRRKAKKARVRQQINQAKQILLTQDPSWPNRIPPTETIAAEVQKLMSIPWKRPQAIEGLTNLMAMRILLAPSAKFVPAPDFKVWGLREVLLRVVKQLERREDEAPEFTCPDSEAAALMLGLRDMTRDHGITVRRKATAAAWHRSPGTIKRHKEAELAELIADELVRWEAALVRSVPNFHVKGDVLSLAPPPIDRPADDR